MNPILNISGLLFDILDLSDEINCCWLFILINSFSSEDWIGVLLFCKLPFGLVILAPLLVLDLEDLFAVRCWPSVKFCGDEEAEDGEALICERDEDEVRLFIRELRAASAFCRIGIGRCMMWSLVEVVYG